MKLQDTYDVKKGKAADVFSVDPAVFMMKVVHFCTKEMEELENVPQAGIAFYKKLSEQELLWLLSMTMRGFHSKLGDAMGMMMDGVAGGLSDKDKEADNPLKVIMGIMGKKKT
ncbi:hypothetical protein LCGC14_1047450 [marine sediment metagenome]|uniref:Uncharacterized protein n=1 Tax=marine sediment metagenome TaxID=412755 RepID=A0A0F9MPW9_9ZZZZ